MIARRRKMLKDNPNFVTDGSLSRITATHLFMQRNLPSDIPTYIRDNFLDLPTNVGHIQLGNYLWSRLSDTEMQLYAHEVQNQSKSHLKSTFDKVIYANINTASVLALCSDKYLWNIFNAHIENKLINDIGSLIDTLHKETQSSVYMEVLLHHSGESYQIFRGAGYDADKEIRKDYPGRTPLCLMQRYQKGYQPTANAEARKIASEHTLKRKEGKLETERRRVRNALLQLVRDGVPTLTTRSVVPVMALQSNNVILEGFSRDSTTKSEGYHWANSATYSIPECTRFFEAFDSNMLHVVWSSAAPASEEDIDSTMPIS